MGFHLVEVDAAKGGKQRTEHHHREDGIYNVAQGITRHIELGHEIKQEIDNRSHSDSYGQRPVFQKLLNTHIRLQR